jgi:hypothetical protein
MQPYIVKQGDYLSKLAGLYGFDADEIWKHEANKKLATLRPDHHLLAPGDILYLPTKPARWLPLKASSSNSYVATVPRAGVALHFLDGEGKPLANEGCLVHGLPREEEGGEEMVTGPDGSLVLSVPVHVRELTVVFYDKRHMSYRVLLGDMDPAEEASGIRKRLEHLGFYGYIEDPYATDDDASERDRKAIADFQRSVGVSPTGEVDDATRESLIEQHGS